MSNKPRAFKKAQREKKEKAAMKQFYLWAILIALVGMVIFYYIFTR